MARSSPRGYGRSSNGERCNVYTSAPQQRQSACNTYFDQDRLADPDAYISDAETNYLQSRPSLEDLVGPGRVLSLVYEDRLNTVSLLQLRKNHNSQVDAHKGNERNKISSSLLNVEANGKTREGKLKASACSKLMAVFMRESNDASSGLARKHRWNIEVKVKVSAHIRNSSRFNITSVQSLFDDGTIRPDNPLEPGKFLVLIKNDVGLPFSSHQTNIDVVYSPSTYIGQLFLGALSMLYSLNLSIHQWETQLGYISSKPGKPFKHCGPDPVLQSKRTSSRNGNP